MELSQIFCVFADHLLVYPATLSFPPSWLLTPDLNVQSWGVKILPFIEQSPLYDRYDSTVPPINEAVVFGFSATTIASNMDVIGTPLDVFICPSVPESDRVYTADVPGGLVAGGFPDISWTAAPSDYCPTLGIRGPYTTIAYAGHTMPALRYGPMQPQVYAPAFHLDQHRTSRVREISDGLSNTVLIAERVGGKTIYLKGGKVATDADVPLGSVDAQGSGNGGGWGDFFNGDHWLSGSPDHGGPPNFGPCSINCTNRRDAGYFSFHPGGAQFLMCDGSVQFLSEDLVQYALAARITRAGGETGWE